MKPAVKLFWIGLAVHVTYNLVVLLTGSKLADFWQADHGQLAAVMGSYNIDTPSYTESADNFAAYGVFGKGLVTDYHRTIGYPAIIYLFKLFFGSYWYFGLAVFQTVFSVLIYPLIYLIGKILLRKESSSIYYASLAVMLLGTYFTRTLFVLTDLTCCVFFILGLYFSLRAVLEERKAAWMLLAVLSISFAALIRPVLVLYPFAGLLLLLYVARLYGTWKERKTRWVIITSVAVLFFTCNFSSMRVYYHHGVLSSSDVLSINMLYTVEAVYHAENRVAAYDAAVREIEASGNWKEQCKKRKEFFEITIKTYPVQSVKYWAGAAFSHLVSTHFTETGNIYGYYKRDIEEDGCASRKSLLMVIVFYAFTMLQLFLIIIPFCFYLYVKFFREKNYLFVLAILSMILLIVAPTFIASTGPRMRMPIEPVLVLLAFDYLADRMNYFVFRKTARQSPAFESNALTGVKQ